MLLAVSQTPRIYVQDDFLEPHEIDHLIAAGTDRQAWDARGVAVKHDTTGFSFEWPVDGDAVLEAIRTRLAGTLGIENRLGATMRFRHYVAGEGHPPHLDTYSIQGQHLIATVMLHLVTCEGGGETHFPRAWPAPVSVKPRARRLVAWFNHYPNGAPDEASYHEGRAIVAGEKMTLTSFVYAPLDAARVRPSARAGWVAD